MLENPNSLCMGCSLAPASGYFGKPTKLRAEEPSMFEILSWDSHPQQKIHVSACAKCQFCNHSVDPNYSEKDEVQKDDQHDPMGKKVQNQSSPHKESRNYSHAVNTPHRMSKNILKQQTQENRPPAEKRQRRQSIGNAKQRPQSAQQRKPTKIQEAMATPNYMKPTRKQIPETEEDRENRLMDEKQKKIQKFVQTTRWIPNSAFTTYFGRPAFENYGRGNTTPTSGGLLYGNYLKSHNVQPHRGANTPDYLQSYSVALMKGKEIGEINPYPPKMNKKDMEVAQIELTANHLYERSPICPEKNTMKSLPIRAPDLLRVEKFGGEGMQKMSKFSHQNLSQKSQW